MEASAEITAPVRERKVLNDLNRLCGAAFHQILVSIIFDVIGWNLVLCFMGEAKQAPGSRTRTYFIIGRSPSLSSTVQQCHPRRVHPWREEPSRPKTKLRITLAKRAKNRISLTFATCSSFAKTWKASPDNPRPTNSYLVGSGAGYDFARERIYPPSPEPNQPLCSHPP